MNKEIAEYQQKIDFLELNIDVKDQEIHFLKQDNEKIKNNFERIIDQCQYLESALKDERQKQETLLQQIQQKEEEYQNIEQSVRNEMSKSIQSAMKILKEENKKLKIEKENVSFYIFY